MKPQLRLGEQHAVWEGSQRITESRMPWFVFGWERHYTGKGWNFAAYVRGISQYGHPWLDVVYDRGWYEIEFTRQLTISVWRLHFTIGLT